MKIKNLKFNNVLPRQRGFTRQNFAKRNLDGFTLIELLVVIAVIGIMMGAVVIAINPKKRMDDARDADGKMQVGAMASAVESCYTANEGTYVSCDTSSDLVSDYLKTMPPDVTFWVTTTSAACTSAKCCFYYNLKNGGYWMYQSKHGKAVEVATRACP